MDAKVVMRTFKSGATRDTDQGKHDIEAFLSPIALEPFLTYMHKKRIQPDGFMRDGDNWQKGIPISVYQKSLIRHVFTAWRHWRTGTDYMEELCAILFNVHGLMYELTRPRPRPRSRTKR
jgi:hypothetical protein